MLLAGVLASAFGLAPDPGAAQPPDERRDRIWDEATLMDLRQRRDDEQLLLMHTVITHARKKDATAESLQNALDEKRRWARGHDGGAKSTRYRNVLRMVAGAGAAVIAMRYGAPPQVPFVAGTILGDEVDRFAAALFDGANETRWRATQRAMDDIRLRQSDRQVVEQYRKTLRERPEFATVAYGALPSSASRPGDSVNEILARHPEFRQMRSTIETKDAVKRHGAILGGIKDQLAELDATLAWQNDETAKLAEEMKSERQRQIDAEVARFRIEGLRGAAFVASTVIGWENPKLGRQVGVIANAGIDIYRAIDSFNRLGENVTGLTTAALTGNVLAAVVSVIDVFIDTGPTPEEQILEAVQQLGRQVHALHQRMDERFDALDVQIEGLGIQIEGALALIVGNQHDMQQQLKSVRKSLERHELVSHEMLEALHRQTHRIEAWFEDMHITPCLMHGEVQPTISADRFAECRNTLAAAGRSRNLEGEPATARPPELELGDYARRPDEMTNAGLQAFRSATSHERNALPATVAGLERWTQVADRMDAFLLRWPAHVTDADRDAGTDYAATMQTRRAQLRRYTEAVRRDLFRHASGRPENAFGRVLEDARSALDRMQRQIEEEMGEEIARGNAHWRHDRERRPNPRRTQSPTISDREASRIVNDLLESGGTSRALGAWDFTHVLKDKHIPDGWRGGRRGYATKLVETIQDVLNRENQWEFVRYLVREGLVDIDLGFRYSYWNGWEDHDSTRNGRPIVTSPWDNPDVDSFDGDDPLWIVDYEEYYELRVRFTALCGDREQLTIRGRKQLDAKLYLRLRSWSDEIVSVRDGFGGKRLADYTLADLEEDMEDYRRSRTIWSNECRRTVRERFEKERVNVEKRLRARLGDDDKWRRDNAIVDLGAARIKNWLRVALYDAIAESPALQELMDETITMRSPERLMREGTTMWRAVEKARREVKQLSEALATAEMEEWLRERYGHEGVMRTLFVGIDPVPDRVR